MDAVLVSSEVAPFSRSGGLGDVAGALSGALARAGHRVMTVSPLYGGIEVPELSELGVRRRIVAGRWGQDIRLLGGVVDGVLHVFVAHPMFDRVGLYGDHTGTFGDNHIRFSVLCRAALEAARVVPVQGSLLERPVLHCHDWHSSLVPLYLDAYYRPLGLLAGSPTVLTLHNPAHQGRLPAGLFDDLELPPRYLGPWALEWYGDLGLLKAGIQHAHALTTVSPSFAWEITRPGGGFGLESLLQARHGQLTGILNGIDTDLWNPAKDPNLPAAYDVSDLSGKAACKAALQTEMGLPVDPDAPLVGSVGRLDPQKGIELIIDSIPWLVSQGAQVVLLGSAAAAHRHYEHQLRELEAQFPHHVRAWIGFSDPLAHRIEAASDVFAMPSLFEPCGLNQLYSLRYGTVPVVRRTGGLADSVADVRHAHGKGTGYLFDAPTGIGLRDALYAALHRFRTDREGFDDIRRRGMALDLSWEGVVPAYERVYRDAAASARSGA